MPVLRLKNTAQKGRVFPLESGERFFIGRDANIEVPIVDQGASRRHAEVYRVGEMYFVRDLGSKNGTYLNDEPVSEELLRSGDKIRIGQTLFIFEELIEEQLLPAFDQLEYEGEEGGDHDTDRLNTTAYFELTRPTRVDAGAYQRRLKTLYDLAAVLNADKAPTVLLNDMLTIAADAVDAGCVYIFIQSREGKLAPRAGFRRNPREKPKISRSIIRQVMREGKPLLLADASRDKDLAVEESVVAKRIRSVICVPLSAHATVNGVIYAASDGARPPFSADDLELTTAVGIQAGTAIDNILMRDRVRRAFLLGTRNIIAAIEKNDPAWEGHTVRVLGYTAALTQHMRLTHTERYRALLGAVLHDIGRLPFITPRHNNPAQTDPAMIDAEHPHIGVSILENIFELEPVLPAIEDHHEYLDGSGAPRGLKGEAIPRLARIVCVANDFDKAMVRGKVDPNDTHGVVAVLKRFNDESGKKYDQEAVAALIKAHRNSELFAPQDFFDFELAVD
ncbi:MAG: FHA domain-containing protein [Planctomycetes bacterium]|nr:FHA domain-containing protein [Planctomycetota bacterium]